MVGRKKEVQELLDLYDSGRAELVAVYGRRRVGKTFLIDETFENRFTFKHAGLSPVDEEKNGLLKKQLDQFYYSLKSQGMKGIKPPKSWMEAFFDLELFLQEQDQGERQVVFIDEIPWMDTQRSGFLTALEGFWNNWGCHRKNLMMIVCGSATSWIMDNLINNHGGLYGRVTYEIKLCPLTLQECELFLNDRGIHYSRYEIAQSYMVMGGIPFYLGYMRKEFSFARNIDEMFFNAHAKLEDEFRRLFYSIFENPVFMQNIVSALAGRRRGYTRGELLELLKIKDGETFSKCLKALIASEFVQKYVPFGYRANEVHYRLIDPFCIFWIHFMKERGLSRENFWQQNMDAQSIVVWRGLAFENVCWNHVPQIKKALGINGIFAEYSAWTKKPDDEEGTQIDLLINRKDNVVNMCEIKFYGDDFAINQNYYRTLLRRREILHGKLSKKTSVVSTLITTFGLKKNEYSGAFTNVVTLDDLFEPV